MQPHRDHERFEKFFAAVACVISLAALVSFQKPASGDEPLPTHKPFFTALPALAYFGEFSPNGDELALAARDNSVLLLDIASNEVRLRLDAREDSDLASIAWSPDGSMLATMCKAGRVELRSTLDGSLRVAFVVQRTVTAPHWELASRLLFFDEGKRIVAAYGPAPTEIRSTVDGALIAQIPLIEDHLVLDAAVSRNGDLLALGDIDGNAAIWSTRTGEMLHGPIDLGGRVASLDLHPERPLLAAGVFACEVRLWSYETKADPKLLSCCDQDYLGTGGAIGFVRFSPDGLRLLSTSQPSWGARMWELATHEPVWRYDYNGGSPAALRAAYCADDGSRVLLGAGGVLIGAKGERERVLEDDGLLHSDGKRAWTIVNNRLKVFDVATGKELLDRLVNPK